MKRQSLILLLAILLSIGCASSQQVLNQYINSQDQQSKQNKMQRKYYKEQEQYQWVQEQERYLKYGF
jgi:hypothetical protein